MESSRIGVLASYVRAMSGHEEQKASKVRPAMPVVVSRQFGSGGKRVAEALAHRLNFHLFDKEILERIVTHAKVPPDIARLFDEHNVSPMEMFGTDLLRGQGLRSDEFARFLKLAIVSLLNAGNVVLLGRGAAFLAKPGTALRLRIVAPERVRISNLVEYEHFTEAEARKKIQQVDHERLLFHKKIFGHAEVTPDCFDLGLSTEVLNVEECTDLALAAYNKIAAKAGEAMLPHEKEGLVHAHH